MATQKDGIPRKPQPHAGAMSIPTGFQAAYIAAHGGYPPMAHEEAVTFACQKAAVRAEDERKRDPDRQFVLEAA